MLKVFGSERKKVGEFGSYFEFSAFIHQQNRFWSFTFNKADGLQDRTPNRVLAKLSISEPKAFPQNFDLLGLHYEPSRPVKRITVSPDICVEELLKSWCQAYAEAAAEVTVLVRFY